MKRNMELVRKILFALEERTSTVGGSLMVEGHSREEVAYHCNLLFDAGLVRAYNGQ